MEVGRRAQWVGDVFGTLDGADPSRNMSEKYLVLKHELRKPM
jgi:hypothetical protein